MPRPGTSHSRPIGNREQWLTEVARQAEPLFKGFSLKPYRVTCGWPSHLALGRKSRVLGQCFGSESSTGGYHELFISPLEDEPGKVAGILCHELAHVAAGTKAGHKGLFVRVCRLVGLTKNKPRQAMPGEVLEGSLLRIIERQGPYPHKAIKPQELTKVKEKKEFSIECADCGCLVRMSAKWVNGVGIPTCACGGTMGVR